MMEQAYTFLIIGQLLPSSFKLCFYAYLIPCPVVFFANHIVNFWSHRGEFHFCTLNQTYSQYESTLELCRSKFIDSMSHSFSRQKPFQECFGLCVADSHLSNICMTRISYYKCSSNEDEDLNESLEILISDISSWLIVLLVCLFSVIFLLRQLTPKVMSHLLVNHLSTIPSLEYWGVISRHDTLTKTFRMSKFVFIHSTELKFCAVRLYYRTARYYSFWISHKP